MRGLGVLLQVCRLPCGGLVLDAEELLHPLPCLLYHGTRFLECLDKEVPHGRGYLFHCCPYRITDVAEGLTVIVRRYQCTHKCRYSHHDNADGVGTENKVQGYLCYLPKVGCDSHHLCCSCLRKRGHLHSFQPCHHGLDACTELHHTHEGGAAVGYPFHIRGGGAGYRSRPVHHGVHLVGECLLQALAGRCHVVEGCVHFSCGVGHCPDVLRELFFLLTSQRTEQTHGFGTAEQLAVDGLAQLSGLCRILLYACIQTEQEVL